MSTLPPNSKTVEEFAQKLLHYEKTMQHHLAPLRKNQESMLALHNLVSQSPPSAHAGHKWPPEPHQRDAYIKHMDEICSMHPSSDRDRMEIIFASHSANTCYMLFYINELAAEIRTKVMARYRDLSQAFARDLMSMQKHNSTNLFLPASSSGHKLSGRIPPSPSHTLPYASPPNLTHRPLTSQAKSTYARNPTTAIGRHFILDPDSDDPLPYKVVGLRVSEGTMTYEVLLAGCCHIEDLEPEEIEHMMDNSAILG